MLLGLLAVAVVAACGDKAGPFSVSTSPTTAAPEASATGLRGDAVAPSSTTAAAGTTAPSPASATSAPASATSPAPAVTSAAPTARAGIPAFAPDGQRIFGHVLQLADTIGLRNAGSSREQAAVDYVAGQLRSYGYAVSIQEFPISAESGREAALAERSPAQRTFSSLPFSGSGSGSVRARLLPAGKGSLAEFPPGSSGAVALIERGDLLFNDKVANAQAVGARAVVIFNNQPGNFLGTLSQSSTLPALSISQEDGRALLNELSAGAVEVDVSVGAAGTAVSHNVIAKPPGRDCETITGGHLDSVVGPGASDNATGTATVLEIALVMSRNGRMGNNCFVLFGAEELGLVGSRAFVQSLDSAARSRIKAMFNYDMVGVGSDGWLLIGNANLQQRGATLADSIGIAVRRGNLPANTGSDHASFANAGIPALMLYRETDNLLHTPQDVTSRVRPELLEQAARIGVALIESFNGGS